MLDREKSFFGYYAGFPAEKVKDGAIENSGQERPLFFVLKLPSI